MGVDSPKRREVLSHPGSHYLVKRDPFVKVLERVLSNRSYVHLLQT
jgi:hypothetical protein